MRVKIKLEKCDDIEIETNKILGIYQRNDIYACGMYVIEYVNKYGDKDVLKIHPSTFKSIKIKRGLNG